MDTSPAAEFVNACCAGKGAEALSALHSHPEHELVVEQVAQWGTTEELVEFLVEHHHLLHAFGAEPVTTWIRHHLWEANRLNVCDFDTPDDRGRFVADVAVQSGHDDLARLIRARQPATVPRINWALASNTPRQESFLKACESADAVQLRGMLQDDPSLVQTRTKWGMTPIYCVGGYGSDDAQRNRETTRLLLEAGDPDPVDGLCGACWWGGGDVIYELLEAGVAVEDRNRERSALHFAAIASRYNDMLQPEQLVPIVQTLLDAGADPNWPDLYGWMPFGMSAGAVREILRKRGATEEKVCPGLEAFTELVRSGASEGIVAAAKRDPDLLRFRDEQTCSSPILSALFADDRELAHRLAAIKPVGVDLDEAAALGDVALTGSALERTPGAPDGPRWLAIERPGRPLHLAAWFGHYEVAELLLERGYSPGDTNQADVAGHFVGPEQVRETTPLHLAAERGHRLIVERFLRELDAHRARSQRS